MRQKNVEIPPYFRCPISFELMKDPVTLSTGITYDRASIQKWLEDGNKACPVTRQVLQSYELIPNYTLHHLMKSWCSSRRPHIDDDEQEEEDGVGPSKKEEVGLEDFLQRIGSEQDLLLDMDYKTLRAWSKCSLEHGIWQKVVGSEGVLGVLMTFLARSSCESDQLKGFPGDEEALSIVVKMCQLDGKIRRRVADSSEFHVMLRFLHSSKSSIRFHAAKLLENLVSENDLKLKIGALSACVEELLGLLKAGASSELALCRDSTNEAALKCLISICTPFKNKLRLIQLGAVNVLIQLLSSSSSTSSATAQKHTMSEHALALLKLLCTCAEGRAAISQVHSKAMPAILDTLLKVSSQATEHGILILWACFCLLGACEDVEDSFLEADGLPKLVMVLQCDCTVVTKQKAGELLKHFSWVWKDIGPPTNEKSTSATAAASGADCTLVDKKHKSPTKSHAAAR